MCHTAPSKARNLPSLEFGNISRSTSEATTTVCSIRNNFGPVSSKDIQEENVTVNKITFKLFKLLLQKMEEIDTHSLFNSPSFGEQLCKGSPSFSPHVWGESDHTPIYNLSSSPSLSTLNTCSHKSTKLRVKDEVEEGIDRGAENDSVIDHCQKELKWVKIIASMSASEARKSRKVRDSVRKGVPSV